MNIALLPPKSFWFPFKDWFTPLGKVTQTFSYMCHTSFHLSDNLNAVFTAWNDCSHPLSTKFCSRLIISKTFLSLPSSFTWVASPLSTWMHLAIYVCSCITCGILWTFRLRLHMRHSETWNKVEEAPALWSSQKFPWQKKSALKICQVPRVDNYLHIMLVCDVCLAQPSTVLPEGPNMGEREERERGRDILKLLVQKSSWRRGEHLDLSQIWSFDYHKGLSLDN